MKDKDRIKKLTTGSGAPVPKNHDSISAGKRDPLVRIVLALTIFALGLVYHSWWGLLGLIPFLTGIVGYCPIYAILGIRTNKKV